MDEQRDTLLASKEFLAAMANLGIVDFSEFSTEDLLSLYISVCDQLPQMPEPPRNEAPAIEPISDQMDSLSTEPTETIDVPDSESNSTWRYSEGIYQDNEEAQPDTEAEPANAEIDKDEMTLQLCELAGCDYDVARSLLEGYNWNFNDASATFFETQVPSYSESTHTVPGVQTGSGPGLSFRFPPPGVGFGQERNRFEDVNGSFEAVTPDSPQFRVPRPPSSPSPYGQLDVRRPDEVVQQRLVRQANRRHWGYQHDELARADAPDVEWMNPPPVGLSSPLPFEEVKKMGKAEKKWILANIQSHKQFASNLLNRDLWSSESVQGVIQSGFYFWQRGDTSRDGRDFIRHYKLVDSDLPKIVIIDPRTGRTLWSNVGNIDPYHFCNELLQFLDTHSLEENIVTKRDKVPSDIDQITSNSSSTSLASMASTLPTPPPPSPCPSTASSSSSAKRGSSASSDIDNWGALPDEPTGGDAVKVSIKLPTGGKPIVRRFLKTDQVRVLFAWGKTLLAPLGQSDKAFDILSGFPSQSLRDKTSMAIQEVDVAGSLVTMRFL